MTSQSPQLRENGQQKQMEQLILMNFIKPIQLRLIWSIKFLIFEINFIH
jgi:hypothetical protein